MKKLAKFLALILAGVMVLSMTACNGVFDEEMAREAILEETNAFREELNLKPLKECKEVNNYASALIKPFEDEETIILSESKVNRKEVSELWKTAVEKLSLYSGTRVGIVGFEDGNEEGYYRLVGKYGSREMLRAQISQNKYMWDSLMEGIGIGFARIDGTVYWVAEVVRFE